MKLHRHGELVLVEVKEIPMEAKEVERGNNIVVTNSDSRMITIQPSAKHS